MEELLDFLQDIKSQGYDFFIEAEGRPDKIDAFIYNYNANYRDNIDPTTDGIICLKPNANKWAIELRLYVPVEPPIGIRNLFSQNRVYRTEYTYRLNDNGIVNCLFDEGYRIGLN